MCYLFGRNSVVNGSSLWLHFPEADEYCEDRGGKLLVIADEAEFAWVVPRHLVKIRSNPTIFQIFFLQFQRLQAFNSRPFLTGTNTDSSYKIQTS